MKVQRALRIGSHPIFLEDCANILDTNAVPPCYLARLKEDEEAEESAMLCRQFEPLLILSFLGSLRILRFLSFVSILLTAPLFIALTLVTRSFREPIF